jgi:bifunctional non-homologous end joining protein LigD
MLPQEVRWRREFAIGPPPMFLGCKPAIEPCLPCPGKKLPTGPDWIHEIKHDDFRIRAWREGERSRLLTRHGTDFTDRFPKIAAAVENLRVRSCVLDGVVCRPA